MRKEQGGLIESFIHLLLSNTQIQRGFASGLT
jgi:hypothetical protein